LEDLVDLFEYQARDIFEKHGVPVLAAAIATTADFSSSDCNNS